MKLHSALFLNQMIIKLQEILRKNYKRKWKLLISVSDFLSEQLSPTRKVNF